MTKFSGLDELTIFLTHSASPRVSRAEAPLENSFYLEIKYHEKLLDGGGGGQNVTKCTLFYSTQNTTSRYFI